MELAEEAQRTFGYSAAKKALEAHFNKVIGRPTVLAILHKLGIKPFTQESVMHYMHETEHKANAKMRAIKHNLICFFTFLTCIGLIGLIGAKVTESSIVVFYSANLCFSVGILSLFLVVALWEGGKDYWKWEEVWLNRGCQVPIPDHVLQTAIMIREKLPDCALVIHHLSNQGRTSDPFLSIKVGGEYLYLEVWDEYEFEKSLISIA